MKRPVICFFGIESVPDDTYRDQDLLTIHCYKDDSQFAIIKDTQQPDVFVTVGEHWGVFRNILANPDGYIKRKWLHYNKFEDVRIDGIYFCYISNLRERFTNPLSQPATISLFTPSYKSGKKIDRPLRSLRAQTYPHWEWIIMDDSPEDPTNWATLQDLQKQDARIRIYRPEKNTGNIGNLKFLTASMGRGEFLAEMDHDDDLTADCLELVIDAFKQFPDAGYLYTDFCELYEDSFGEFEYGKVWGLHHGAYYGQLATIPGVDRPIPVKAAVAPNLNTRSISHIVAAPNHIRVWRKSLYQSLGGHHPLPVGDDYELTLRSFIKSRIIKIPYLCYFQYRNASGNTTFRRNALINTLQNAAWQVYSGDVLQKFKDLGVATDTIGANNKTVWEQDPDYHEDFANYIYYKPNTRDHITVIVSYNGQVAELYKCLSNLLKQRTIGWEAIVVGDTQDNSLEALMKVFPYDPRFRWWNQWENYNDNGITALNYALRLLIRTPFVTYMKAGEVWTTDHLEKLYKSLRDNDKDAVLNDKGFLHKFSIIKKIGYWRVGDSEKTVYDRWVTSNENAVAMKVAKNVEATDAPTIPIPEPQQLTQVPFVS